MILMGRCLKWALRISQSKKPCFFSNVSRHQHFVFLSFLLGAKFRGMFVKQEQELCITVCQRTLDALEASRNVTEQQPATLRRRGGLFFAPRLLLRCRCEDGWWMFDKKQRCLDFFGLKIGTWMIAVGTIC